MIKKGFFVAQLFLVFMAMACDGTQKVDRSGIKEEMANRELKKVSEADILNEATRIGQSIAADAEKLIQKKSNELSDGASTDPVRKAHVKWVHSLDSLEDVYEAEIKFLSLITSKDASEISPLEEELLDAYQYNLENKISLSENIQKSEKGFLLYNKPIILSSNSCLRCHGTPGETVDEQTLTSLKENFPTSKAPGYTEGSIMGFWSIKLSQKKIINEL
ncbi:MAG: DUF3365 domain-containing protein [Bacteroidota bacterium]|nr:DUF3365 domain-containing protein [Bacteroidota bacterium]